MRETIFIGHATPEDNEFTIWLASRLRLLGYEVWIDKSALIGGEKFWDDIDDVIRNKAAKYLLVYSTNICQKDDLGNRIIGKLKDGISKEYSLAESIAKQHNIQDFIVLLNIDASTYNLFIDAPRLNQIPFFDNWADGFKQLKKKLIKDSVPCNNTTDEEGFGSWYEEQFITNNTICSKSELYYSNWWPVERMPQSFYIYQFENLAQATRILKQNTGYLLSKISNCLSSFEYRHDFLVDSDGVQIKIKPKGIFEIKISDVLMGFESSKFPNQRDAENHFKQLLNKAFHQIMRNRGMFWYKMANKKLAYYFTVGNLPTQKVKFEYPFRKNQKFKTKNLIGKHKQLGKWHFALSAKPILFPVVGYSLKSHITFTDDGKQVWKDNSGGS